MSGGIVHVTNYSVQAHAVATFLTTITSMTIIERQFNLPAILLSPVVIEVIDACLSIFTATSFTVHNDISRGEIWDSYMHESGSHSRKATMHEDTNWGNYRFPFYDREITAIFSCNLFSTFTSFKLSLFFTPYNFMFMDLAYRYLQPQCLQPGTIHENNNEI